MSHRFNGACFVAVDVTCLGADDALVGLKEMGDDDAVCLRAADRKVNAAFRNAGCIKDLLGRFLCDFIAAVAYVGRQIFLCETGKDFRRAAAVIVVHENNLAIIFFLSYIKMRPLLRGTLPDVRPDSQ